MNQALLDDNKLTFAKFSIGDKLVITHNNTLFKKDTSTQFGILTQFGYSSTGELLLGIQFVASYCATEHEFEWFHPRNTLRSIETV